jgi:hypothetical protein
VSSRPERHQQVSHQKIHGAEWRDPEAVSFSVTHQGVRTQLLASAFGAAEGFFGADLVAWVKPERDRRRGEPPEELSPGTVPRDFSTARYGFSQEASFRGAPLEMTDVREFFLKQRKEHSGRDVKDEADLRAESRHPEQKDQNRSETLSRFAAQPQIKRGRSVRPQSLWLLRAVTFSFRPFSYHPFS